MKEDDWGNLFTDESDGTFNKIVNIVGEQSAKISHNFAITAWVCSIQPQIMLDVEACMTGYHHDAIKEFIKILLAHDIDAEEDEKIDLKVDKFWDEYRPFQKR